MRNTIFREKRIIYNLHFRSNLEGVSSAGIITFARLVDQADKHTTPSEWLKARLVDHGIQWVDINPTALDHSSDHIWQVDDADQPDEPAVKKAQVSRHYAQVFGSVKEVSRKLASSRNVGIRNTVRLVQKMVDIVTENESIFSILI